MGITERRERERNEIQRKILDAARELFASEGYERVTMRRIAEAIEYSPTTIYHHFEDKDDLVKALCNEDFSRLLGALGQAEVKADPVEAIRQLGHAYCQFGLDHPNHYRFMFMTANKVEDHKADPDDAGNRSFEVLRGAVARAIESGRFRPGDTDLVAQVLWASIHGAVALLITVRPDQVSCAPTKELIPAVVDNSIRGLLSEA